MYCLELTKQRPAGCSPYYTLCVRDRFTIGRVDTSDIALNSKEVSRQHATVTVSSVPIEILEEEDQLRQDDPDNAPFGVHYPALTFTNHSKHGSMVDGKMVVSTVGLQHGSTVALSSNVEVRVHLRPVVVAISDTYTDEYFVELRTMLTTVGATVIPGPQPLTGRLAKQQPLGCFFICEEIDSSADVLRAMAFGYQLVTPGYVFELFGCVSESTKVPLHELPPPKDFEPSRSREIYGKYQYLSPLLPNAPFSLFPMPKQTMHDLTRAHLFAARLFQFRSDIALRVLGQIVELCGGKVKFEEEEDNDEEGYVPRMGLTTQQRTRSMKLIATSHVASKYIVLSRVEHELCMHEGVVDPQVHELASEDGWTVISELCVMQGLLTNEFRPIPITLPPPPISPADLATEASNDEPRGRSPRYGDFGVTSDLMSSQKEVDSDATPSDIDSEEFDVTGYIDANPGQKLLNVAVTREFTVLYEKIKATMDRNVNPDRKKVEEVLKSAKQHRYIKPNVIDFLEGVYERCDGVLRNLEELSVSEQGNSHSLLLNQQWDRCVETQRKVEETIQYAARLGDPVARSSPYLHAKRVVPPFNPVAASSASEDPDTDSVRDIGSSSAGTAMNGGPAIRESTMMVRYYPPVPVRARIHTLPPRKNANHVDDISKAKLLISIPPTEIHRIGKHRVLFLRRYGPEEGEKRFAMWLTSQDAEWNTTFNRSLEAKGWSLQQLLQETSRRL